MLGDEIEKVPLRHETEELTMRRQVSQIRKRNHVVSDLSAELSDLLVRPLEKFFNQA